MPPKAKEGQWKNAINDKGKYRERRPILAGNEGIARITEPLEPIKAYRAFLLYAMQDEDRRSQALAGQAMGFSVPWVRKIAGAWHWTARLKREGTTAQARAIQIYRDMFGKDSHTQLQVAVVEPNMSVPSIPLGAPPNPETGVGDATRDTMDHEKRLSKESFSAVGDVARKLQRFSGLLEAMIGGMGQQVYSAISSRNPAEFAKLGIKASDIPRFVREWVALQELQKQQAPVAELGGAQLEPSFRVKQAKQRGESVAAAHLADALEVTAILQAIVSSEAGGATAPRTQSPQTAQSPGLKIVPGSA